MNADISRVLITEEEIQAKVAELAQTISKDYANEELLLICVLRGSIIFTADLARKLTIPVQIDTIAVSSYGSRTETSGVVRLIKDLDENIRGRHVMIIEDIVDSGLTLQYLKELLEQRGPASVNTCTFLNKRERRLSVENPDYYGFIIPNEFVVGYGMDYNENYRQLPYIGVLHPHIYTAETDAEQ